MKLKTYLAGAFCPYLTYTDWRDFVKEKSENKIIEFYDPGIDSRQLCPATFTLDDAQGVLDSDILFHYRTKGYEDEGASWEHGIAFAINSLIQQKIKIPYKEKLILYVDDTSAPFPLHSTSASLTLSNLETAIYFLNNIKSIKTEDWLLVYLDIINKDRAGK